VFLLISVPLLLWAQSLQELLELAVQNNDMIKAKSLQQKARGFEVEARQSAYYPTVDIGGFYQSVNDRTMLLAGDVYSGYATVGVDLYDGGQKSSRLKQSSYTHQASRFETDATKKSLALKIVQDFYTIKSLEVTLLARDEAKRSLQEQLTRMQRFYAAKVATKDDVDRLQAAYDTNIYEMESLKLQIITLKKLLSLQVGVPVDTLTDSKFVPFKEHELETIENVKSLQAQKEALKSGADAIESVYYPQIRVEDTYNLYGYKRTDAMHPKGVDSQNKILLSLNFRLYDNATLSKTKEAVIANSQALNSQMIYSQKEQQMQYELAHSRVKTSYIKIKSAKSALIAAQSAFETISKKYDAGIVDNVVYLDALSAQTSAKALYETSLNDLEVAQAIYYYYAGKNIEEFLQ
jgi:outer membrane protein TolC